MKNIKKGLCSILAVVFLLTMMTGVCYANDGMPVLTFEHDSYVGSPQSTITVGANVTEPGYSKPMQGIKVSFTLKDCNGNETSLGTQTSNSSGLVTCDVALGNDFPYTLSGSASDGVNVTSVTIKSDSGNPTPSKDPEPTVKQNNGTNTTTQTDSNTTLWIIILIAVVVVATIIIIVVVSKKNKNRR